MTGDDRSPLADWIEEAYDRLARETAARDGGIPIEEARDSLAETGLERGDADYAIERLLERGYLYSVGDELFVTDPNR